jgi:hypothetical protein
MSSLNKKKYVTTHEGAKTILPTAEEQLKRLTMSCMLWENTFYEEGKSIADRIKNTILDSVSFWLPYITITSIEVEATDELRDNNQVNLYVQFSMGDVLGVEEVTFTVQG